MCFNNQKIPYRFFSLIIIFGSFIGRQLSIYLNLLFFRAFLLMFFLGLFSSLLVYIILIGFFILASHFANTWGNAFFTYLVNKVSSSVLQKKMLIR